MIDKKTLINLAVKTEIKPEALEKDYVMNLILDAFARCPSTADTFFFKGGCCVHKCFSFFEEAHEGYSIDPYFTEGRFSSDIDLTLTQEMMDADRLKEAFSEVAVYLEEVHGLKIDQFDFPMHDNNKDNKVNCRGMIHFQGPLYNSKFNSPSLKFDLTADERVVFEPFVRPIWHPYCDKGEEVLLIAKTYTLRDIFAEKLRALFERCSARDVFDMHILIRHPDLDDMRQIGIGLSIIEKFKLKNVPLDLRLGFFDEQMTPDGISFKQRCEESWGKSLTRQLPKQSRDIITFDSYWNRGQLAEILSFSANCVSAAQRQIELIQKGNPNMDYNKVLDDALRRNRKDPGVSHFQRALQRLPRVSVSSVIGKGRQNM